MTNVWKRAKQGISDVFYDLSCKLFPPRKPKNGKSGMKSQRRDDYVFYWVMLAIPLLQFAVMYVGVNFNSVLLAFKDYDANFDFTWTLANFAEVFERFGSDVAIHRALENSFLFWLCGTVLPIPVSLLISYYFYKKYFGSRLLKTLLFVPSVISSVVTVTCFLYIVNRGYPLVMDNLFGMQVQGLLADLTTIKGTMLFYNIFFSLASGFIFFSSAMSGIEPSISESAQIDGANIIQEFFYITLPSIYPLLSTWFLSGIASMFISDYSVYAFSRVGNVINFETIGYYFMSGITNFGQERYPFYSALGLVFTVISAIIVTVLRALSDRIDPFNEKMDERRMEKRAAKAAKKGA